MKRKVYCTYIISVSILLALTGACTSSEGSSSIDAWVASHVNKSENLLCQHEVNGDYFFIARTGNKIKVGSRLDVTGAGSTPKTFIIGWQFQNEKDNYLITNTPPSLVKEEYVRNNGKMYAEHIQYQTLQLSESQKMRVTIDIKKCSTENCSRQKIADKEEKQYKVNLCEVPLNVE